MDIDVSFDSVRRQFPPRSAPWSVSVELGLHGRRPRDLKLVMVRP